MPDEHAIPTDEKIENQFFWFRDPILPERTLQEIEKNRGRWQTRWIEDVIHALQDDPRWGAEKIAELPWYTVENGFERWRDEEEQECHEMFLEGRPILDLRGCPFPENVNLKGVTVPLSHFEGARLVGANLSGAILDMASLSGARLAAANLSDARLNAADLSGVVLSRANLSRASLEWATLSEAELYKANLSEADLGESNLSRARFGRANLSGTRLEKANLLQAWFANADLSGAVLTEANLMGVTFIGCSLAKAGLHGARFLDCFLFGIDLRSPEGYAACNTDTFFGRIIGGRGRRTIWLFDKRVLKKQERELKDAMNVCSEIRLCLRDNGLFHKAAIYYEQEEYWRTRAEWEDICRKESEQNEEIGDKEIDEEEIGKWTRCFETGNRLRSFILLCRYILGEKFMGYGEHPGYIIGWSFALILSCAVIFFLSGFQYETAPRVFEPMSSSSFVFLSGEAWMYLLKCLRFSIENFVTLGFSKMQPAEGLSHWAASLEGIVGVLFVALATVTWARKAIRD